MSKPIGKVVNLYEYKQNKKEKEVDREQLLKLIKKIIVSK
ncbi:hypothetical protein JGS6364_32951 [[Clostridium] sordellii]|uniref:Uncharacterized protein n=1 Tax=Paraclostridium sordellii TaxID=1505 RepID=A0A9P1L1E9_PARSO|nr:hypothetical protein H476_3378 [[Clostridium] sordellii VPI 9048] [Paeniclostridium sordellii VPI 9048]CEJ75399.1 hypothetical protein ATCC9714_32871 [[Clostridium] sordellii] [Paeniclostridium sordellii]CEK31653.1 hypothetical protein JGS6364_32951 [[Clostridium] sordellii] [Paeniclostridium sordellii]CEK35976.1 hypothetical protein UMC2_38641 [[Clostridium] sordellii] [Paeniclostridium sordellii]CEK39920.1 hypothetical protein JGS6382_32481 [[Clostridium] sordellii] [Paeniclostridium sorde